ncbi:MAG TPA: hypothetical protein VKR32_19780 [Puia sp.]|nr:hypothetical protein [Puia sp.]
MFSQIWKKYLPAINILMKRSSTANQVLSLDSSDFNRAAGGRKAKLHFSSVHLNAGRVNALTLAPPIAMDLLLVLQQNDRSEQIIKGKNFEFSMSSDFQLLIKDNTPPPVMEETIKSDVASPEDLA